MRRKEVRWTVGGGRQKKENSRSGDLLAPLCGAAGRVGERSPVHGRGKPVSVQSGLHTSAPRSPVPGLPDRPTSTFTLYDSIDYPDLRRRPSDCLPCDPDNHES